MNPWPILAALILALGAGAGGYIKGRADNEARHIAINVQAVLAGLKQASIDAKAQRETADALKAQSRQNADLLRDYENEVGTNIGAVSCSAGDDGLRRLKALAVAAEAAVGQ